MKGECKTNLICDETPVTSADPKYDRKLIRRLLEWYEAHHRELPWRRDRDPYHVWISEIMLQQTRVAAVIGYYERFMQAFPDIEALASADDERLMKLWEGLGYYNRARNLKKAATEIRERFGGVFPKTYEEILSLSGIGAYTAGAIASICFGAPTPAVDGNVLRVYSRLYGDSSCIDLESTKKAVRLALISLYNKCRTEERGKMTQCWMELGATVCVPNGPPLCADCPLVRQCVAHRTGTEDRYPVRAEKKNRKVEERTVWILLCGDTSRRVALHLRPKKGLLAGLWEFPNLEGHLSMEEAVRRADDWGAESARPWMSLPYTHVFSHVEWRMEAHFIFCKKEIDYIDEIGELKWFQIEEQEMSAAVPSAFRPFLNLLKNEEGHF